jgi:hypothetical protein
VGGEVEVGEGEETEYFLSSRKSSFFVRSSDLLLTYKKYLKILVIWLI